MWRIVNAFERARCFVLGHVWFDDPRFSWVWCTECPKKFRRPYVDRPRVGEFYD